MIDSLIEVLDRYAHALSAEPVPGQDQELLHIAGQLPQYSSGEVVELFSRLAIYANASAGASVDSQAANQWPQAMAMLFCAIPGQQIPVWLPVSALPDVADLYQKSPDESSLRNLLLSFMICHDSEQGLDMWFQLICTDPPNTSQNIQLAFSPLTKARSAQLTDDMMVALVASAPANVPVATAIYELANHQFRKEVVSEHPLENRAENLTDLLGTLVGRLAQVEEGNLPNDGSPEAIAQTIQDSVSLIIAIMDALSLIKHEPAVGKFNQALELRHRRIQVEAATALARMDDEAGKKTLVSLAQHPVVRPRVIAYAEELGIESEISLEHQGPIAVAESELALWLSQPDQMGFAPTEMELVEQRELYWPSYEEPLTCFLFSYEYGSGEQAFRNVGISGPLTHAFTADLCSLSTADQFSAFAGWQTVSDEIYMVAIGRAEELLAGETDRLRRRMAESPVDEPVERVLASFFGEFVLVVSGIRDGKPGTMIVQLDQNDWIEQGNPQSPVEWHLALDIWKGRKLLTNFNPAFS